MFSGDKTTEILKGPIKAVICWKERYLPPLVKLKIDRVFEARLKFYGLFHRSLQLEVIV